MVMDPIIIFGVAALILVIAIGGAVRRARNSKKVQGLAAERGWRYEKSDAGVLSTYPQLFPFYSHGEGRSKPGISFGDRVSGEARDVLYLTEGEYSGQSFTYTYTTYERDSDGDTSSKKHYWHVVGFELPTAFPNLTIRRRRKLDFFENKLTKPVDLPYSELNSAYTIHSEHAPAALDIVTAAMAQWLVREQFRAEIVLQDRRVYVYTKGRQKIENIDPMVKQIIDFLAHIPQEAWQKTRGEYPQPQRVKYVESLDLNQMKSAYDDWRESQ